MKPLLAVIVTLLFFIAYPNPTNGQQKDLTAESWADSLISVYYDDRAEKLQVLARMSNSQGSVEALAIWKEALKGKTTKEIKLDELMMFNLRYDPIWKGNQHQKSESTKLAARIKLLPEKEIK